MQSNPTACLIIIGNEILSGRTIDKNLSMIALKLNEAGVQLREVRVIPDVESTIILTLNSCREQYDYVFTTGGIGPTHDDITAEAVAKAFGVALLLHPDAEQRLLAHYKPEDVNDARMKMAMIPEGAALIDNPISAAPGFVIGNVHVLAGVPSIAKAMMDFIVPSLKGGLPVLSRVLDIHCPEGQIASGVEEIQHRYPAIEIGIYPKVTDGMLRSTIVMRSTDAEHLALCTQAMSAFIVSEGIFVQEITG